MSEIEFGFQDTINEIQALETLAGKFLQPSSRSVLSELARQLESIRDSGGTKTWRWEIKETYPLLTRVSEGAYQRSNKGLHNVWARITCLWEVRRVEPPKSSLKATRFALTGIASTKVRLLETDGAKVGNELGTWRMEVGDSASPGCHFHVQVGGESNDLPFPKSLDVPRLPGLLSTPPAVVEFVIGELFQDEWARHCAIKSAALNRWAPIQKRRLTALLGWEQDIVSSSSGSPWTTLKQAKPSIGLFA